MSKNQKALLFVSSLIFMCIGVIVYFTAFRRWDYKICHINIAQKLDLQNDETIYSWIRENVEKGMTRDEVLSVIAKIGPNKITQLERILNNGTVDVIVLKTCLHPMNNIHVRVFYDSNGLFEILEFESEL